MLLVARSTLAQCAPAITVCLAFASCGIIAAWTSPVLPVLEGKNSSIPITSDQGSWIVSVIGLGGLMAPFVGYFLNRYGRRPVLIASGIPIITSFILIVFASSPTTLLVARSVAGIGITCIFVSAPIYVGEIAQEDIRGILGAMLDLFYSLGSLFSYCLGPHTSFAMFGGLCAIPPSIFLLAMIFMPESPYYCLKKNKREEAEFALMYLRWKSAEDVQEELDLMQNAVLDQMHNKSSFRDLFSNRASRRALLITIVLVVIQQFSGMMAIVSYTQQIFDLTPGLSFASSKCAMVVGGIQVLAGSVTVSLVDKVGRRPLLITSSIGCGLVLSFLGTYFYIHSLNKDISGFEWVPLTCLVMFVIFFCLGLSPVPIFMLGEVFGTNVKDLAVSINILFIAISYGITTKIYQIMVDVLGDFSPFFLFSGVCFFGAVFVFFIVPETKGKRFETIIAELEGYEYNSSTDIIPEGKEVPIDVNL